jgi:phosphoribosyl-ATP pyrophosphohydrolase/phosphoribosyl-AMP cyclohydrolase
MFDINDLNFEKGGGTVTVVTQDSVTGAVLMVAAADSEALQKTLDTGEMHYRSRTRGLWHKGETSGNTQRLVSLQVDCDSDAVLARVIPQGPACHTGAVSCFGDSALAADVFAELDSTIAERAANGTDTSYTRRLLSDRNLRLKKIGEEAAELVTACADGDKLRATEEAADLTYHTLVALQAVGASLTDLRRALAERMK